MVPCWVPIIIRHLKYSGYPKRDPNFDNHPHVDSGLGLKQDVEAQFSGGGVRILVSC